MRNAIFLLAGLIGGYLIASMWQQSSHTPTNVAANPETEPTPPLTKLTSPFAPVTPTKTATPTSEPSPAIPSLADDSNTYNTTTTPIETTDLGNLKHYGQLAGFFAQLETADAGQVQQLAQQIRSQFQHNYSNQYYNIISAAVYQRWADIDFDAALNSLANVQTAMHGPDMGITMNMLQVLAKEQPQRMQTWMQSQNRAIKDMVQYTVYAGMAENDPQAMVQQALEMNTADSEDMLQMALSQWAQKDPEAAWHYMQSTASAEQHPAALHSILHTWIDIDTEGALPILEQLMNDNASDNTSRNSYTGLYYRALARTDPQSVLNHLSAHSSPEQFYSMDQGALYELANHHPAILENWIRQLPDDQLTQLGPMVIMPLIETQAMSDPRAAMNMIEKFPHGRDMGIQSMILDQWLTTDSPGAIEWLTNQPDTETNQQLLQESAFMLIHSGEDRATAMTLLNQLNKPIDQQTAIQLAAAFASQDLQEARHWLSQNTDPATYAIASIAIDVNDYSIPTEQLLQQLDSTGATLQPHIFMDILSPRLQDRDAIEQWLETTSTMPQDDRAELKMMLGFGDDGWYSRPGAVPPYYGQ